MKWLDWRVIVAGVVVFVVGVGAGGVLEHEKVKHDSQRAGWFAGHTTAACPTLKRWDAAATATDQALATSTSWTSTQSELSKQTKASKAALQSLLGFSTYKGQAGLNTLVSYASKLIKAVPNATSAAGFSTAQKQLNSSLVTTDTTTLKRAATSCSTG
jgi:hypothetical protein